MISLNLMRGRIPLTQGQVTKVDEKDWERLHGLEWHAAWEPRMKKFYAVRVKDGRTAKLHREIMGLAFGNPLQVDHVNHDTLDNRRENLRVVTNRANCSNRKHGAAYGVGVRKDPTRRGKQFQAHAKIKDVWTHIGRYETPEEARAARTKWLAERGLA